MWQQGLDAPRVMEVLRAPAGGGAVTRGFLDTATAAAALAAHACLGWIAEIPQVRESDDDGRVQLADARRERVTDNT